MTVEAGLTPAGRRILRAASELFYARGIHAVGVEAVAAAAGVTKKTLYDRFGSKDALVAAYLAARDERWRTWLVPRVEAAGPDPRARLLATFDALGEWMARENPRGCGFVNAYAELVDPDHPGRRVAQEQKHWLRAYLRDLVGKAGRPAPDRLAGQLFMLHEGVLIAYSVGGDDDAAATARAAAEVLLDA